MGGGRVKSIQQVDELDVLSDTTDSTRFDYFLFDVWILSDLEYDE